VIFLSIRHQPEEIACGSKSVAAPSAAQFSPVSSYPTADFHDFQLIKKDPKVCTGTDNDCHFCIHSTILVGHPFPQCFPDNFSCPLYKLVLPMIDGLII
jgi:hypothetical protein